MYVPAPRRSWLPLTLFLLPAYSVLALVRPQPLPRHGSCASPPACLTAVRSRDARLATPRCWVLPPSPALHPVQFGSPRKFKNQVMLRQSQEPQENKQQGDTNCCATRFRDLLRPTVQNCTSRQESVSVEVLRVQIAAHKSVHTKGVQGGEMVLLLTMITPLLRALRWGIVPALYSVQVVGKELHEHN